MKWRAKWFVAGKWWRCDYKTPEQALKRAKAIALYGFQETSKAGAITVYPSHRVSRITVRQIRAAQGGS